MSKSRSPSAAVGGSTGSAMAPRSRCDRDGGGSPIAMRTIRPWWNDNMLERTHA